MSVQKFVPFAVIALLLVATALTLDSGIWADEVSYKILLERYFITGGYRESLLPFCANGFLVAPPAILVPAAALWAQLTWLGSGWLSYRLVPYISLAIVFLVLIRHNFKRNNRSFWPLLSFVTLGTMPFAINLLRPEPIILGGCMVLFFIGTHMLTERRSLHLYLYGLAALLLYSMLVFIHPKAIYLAAVLLISILLSGTYLASRGQRAAYRVIFLAGFSLITYEAISFGQKQALSCQALPVIQKMLNALSVNPMDIFNSPARLLSNLRLALGSHAPIRTISLLLYRAGFDADFLPLKASTTPIDLAADLFIAIAVAGIAIYVMAKFLTCLYRLKNAAERRELYLIASVMAALAIPYILSVEKSFYEVACFGWTMMIAAVLLWPLSPRITENYRWVRTGAFAALMALSAACAVLSYNNFVRPWLDDYRGWGIVPRFADMTSLDREIGEMLAEAHIGLKEPLVVSELTYEAAKFHPYVVPVDYMGWGFTVPGATKAYMERFKVRYGVVECNMFKLGKEFPARLLMTRRFTPPHDATAKEAFDICLFRITYS